MSLYPTVTTYPPLKKLTALPSSLSSTKLPITALLTNATGPPAWPYVVHVHYHITPSTSTASQSALPPPARWPSIALTETNRQGEIAFESGASKDAVVIANVSCVRTQKEADHEQRRVFTGELDIGELVAKGGRVTFAVRWLMRPEDRRWRWEGSEGAEGGVSLGDVLLPAKNEEVVNEDVVRGMLGLKEEWKISACGEGTGEGVAASVFEVTSNETMPRIEDGTLAFAGTLAEMPLGKVKDQVRYMSLVRLEPYWLGVQHGLTKTREWETDFDQSMDGVLVAFLLKSGQVLVLLAFNGNEDVYTVIRSGKEGEVVMAARNDSSSDEKWRALVATGKDVDSCIESVVKEARRKVMAAPKMQKLLQGAEDITKNTEMAKESWFDGLAYCTWNGLDMHRCNAKAVIEGIETLEKNGVHIETFLLDDCWQTTLQPDGKTEKFGAPNAGWDCFEPNKNFPDGLKAMVTEVRSKHKGIKSFGIWHAMYGYWGGISEYGWIAKNYKTRWVKTKSVLPAPDQKQLIVDPEDIERFYDDLYSWLSGEGIDFVKTDVQHMLSMLEDTKDREEVPAAYQRAWTLGIMKHFRGKAISCMSQTPQTLLHSLLQDKTPKVMHRNSDDFFPNIVKSNPWHIHVNAFNALLDRHLNVVPDWDMYQTGHDWSHYHTAARAISGGPILITDIPGQHDTDLVEQMTAKSLNGTLIALRPRPAATIDHWSSYADGNLCKIGTSTGEGKHTAGMLGVFNVVESTVSELISMEDFQGVEEAEELMVVSHRTGQVFGPLKRRGGNDLFSLTLAVKGYDILTAYPVASEGLAVMGLKNKMGGAAAVTRQAVEAKKVKVSLKALGKLVLWAANADAQVKTVQIRGKTASDSYIVSREHTSGKIFDIDLLKFWQENDIWNAEDEEVEVGIELV